MTNSKKRIIAIIFAVLITSSPLVGCADKQVTPPSTEDNSAKYTEQIAHYESLIRELEAELLLNKEENYIVANEYKHQIDSLEESIADLNDKLSAIAGNSEKAHEEQSKPDQTKPVETAKVSEFSYTVVGNEATVTGYNGSEAKIEIPSHIDGFAVTSIGESAFKNCTASEIILPDSVTHIDWFAFSDCSYLTRVTIPASVTKICYGAFQNCARGLTIICENGSYAKAFAASWGIPTKTQ